VFVFSQGMRCLFSGLKLCLNKAVFGFARF
jgi:hypothetical protein